MRDNDRTIAVLWRELKPIVLGIPGCIRRPHDGTEMVAHALELRNARARAVVIVVDLMDWFKL